MTVDAREPIVRAGQVASFAKPSEPTMFAVERVARRIQRQRSTDETARRAVREHVRARAAELERRRRAR